MFPVWLGFRGGKGVATGAGLFVPLGPSALSVALGVFGVTLVLFRHVSLASIAASLSLPIALYLLGASFTVTLTGLAAACLVVVKHRANIGRLLRGVEPRVGRKE
jgi:glycerol-3-phosphate acyltransferase PlsY